MQYTYKFDVLDDDRLQRDLNGENIRVGDEVLVYSCYNMMTGSEEFRISKRFAQSGYPGNLDSSVKRFHGWRGSYNDIATYAHGVYTVKSVDYVDGDFRGQYLKVVINRKDIRKGED